MTQITEVRNTRSSCELYSGMRVAAAYRNLQPRGFGPALEVYR